MQTSLLDQNTSMFNSWRESLLLIIHQQPYGLYAGMGRHDPVGFSFLPGGQPFTIPDMAICLAGSSENLDQGPQRTVSPPWTAPAKTQLNLKAAILLALSGQLVLWTVWGLLGLWRVGETTGNATWDSRALSDFMLSITLLKHTYTHFHNVCRTNPHVSAAFTVLQPLVPINL